MPDHISLNTGGESSFEFSDGLIGFPFACSPDPLPASEPPKIMASLPLDADLLAWFQSETEPANWQEHINGVLRFYVETNQTRDAEFQTMMEAPELEPAS